MIAERIKILREQKHITQSELAKHLSITRSSVNAWEMGISVPSTQYLVLLAEFFSVSADYLLGINATSTVNVSGLNDEDIELVNSLVEHLRNINRHK